MTPRQPNNQPKNQVKQSTPWRSDARRRNRRLLAGLLVAGLLASTAAIAAVVLSQPASLTPGKRDGASMVTFAAGDDVASLVDLGFMATPTIHASGASASLDVKGIPGATQASLGQVLKVSNPDTLDNLAFDVTLTASGALTGVTVFTATFTDGVTTHTIDLLAGGSVGPLNLADGETWNVSVTLGISPTVTPTGTIQLAVVATQA